MFRIDPIDKYGAIDVEFFAREDYYKHRNNVQKYLELEGFWQICEPIIIKLNDRNWLISKGG